jgi:hypothetical protein
MSALSDVPIARSFPVQVDSGPNDGVRRNSVALNNAIAMFGSYGTEGATMEDTSNRSLNPFAMLAKSAWLCLGVLMLAACATSPA